MSVMPLLIICSIAVAAGFLFAYLWAVKKGQFDDLQTPAMKMVFEERAADQPSNNDKP